MATQGTLKYDKYLTDLSLAYPAGNYIGEIVCPIKKVTNYADRVFLHGQEKINRHNDEAESTPSNNIDFAVGTPYSFRSTRKALNSVIKDKEAANAEAIYNAKVEETEDLTDLLRLAHEKRVVDILTSASKVTQYKDVDGTANARWDESTPVLETDIILALNTIYASTGQIANTIVIPYAAALYAANMSFIKSTLMYTMGMNVVRAEFQNQVMQTVGLPPVIKGLNVVVSSGRINDANKGQTASIGATWGNDCLIGYVPPKVGKKSNFGVLTMEYDSRKVSTERVTDPAGTKIVVEWDYDILEADLKNWYLLQNVIA
jgi:hypothetical protein